MVYVFVLLRVLFVFTVTCVSAYLLLSNVFKARKPLWLALTYSFAQTIVFVSGEYGVQLLYRLVLTVLGTVAIIAVAVATAIPLKYIKRKVFPRKNT